MRGRNHERLEDRRAAIARALALAHLTTSCSSPARAMRTYQIRGTETLPFDEQVIVREKLAAQPAVSHDDRTLDLLGQALRAELQPSAVPSGTSALGNVSTERETSRQGTSSWRFAANASTAATSSPRLSGPARPPSSSTILSASPVFPARSLS
jgi:hypothetical protein